MLEELLGRTNVPGLEAHIERHLGLTRQDALREVVNVVLRTVNAVRVVAPDRWNPFARDTLEATLLTAALGDIGSGLLADRRPATLTKIASMGVPKLSLPVADLIKLRESDDSFAEWRQALHSALEQVEMLPDTNLAWQATAREVVVGELQPLVDKLEKTTAKSPALSAVRSGVKGFLLGGFGAAATAALTGDLLGGVAGVAATAGLTAGDGYVGAFRQRRADRALLQVALAFSDSPIRQG
jgi:hypothetical protein